MYHARFYSVLLCFFVSASSETTLYNRRRLFTLSSSSTIKEDQNIQINDLTNTLVSSNCATVVNRLWPPWPFSSLIERNESVQSQKKSWTLPMIQTRTTLLWAYLRERANIGTLQLQQGPCFNSKAIT